MTPAAAVREAVCSPGFTARGQESVAAASNDTLRQPLLGEDDDDVAVSARAGDDERSAAEARLASLHANDDAFWQSFDFPRAAQESATSAGAAHGGDGEGCSTPAAPPPSFGRLLRFAAPEALLIAFGLLALLLRLPFSLAMPHFVSVALGRVLAGDFGGARLAVKRFFAVGLANASLDFFNWFLFVRAQQSIIRRVRNELFAAILRQEVAFFDAASTGSLVSRLTSDCSQLASDLTWIFRWSLEAVVRTAGITAYLLVSAPRLGALAWALVPATAAVNRVYGRKLAASAATLQEALAGANDVAAEVLGSARTVAAAGATAHERRRYAAWNRRAYDAGVRQGALDGIYFAVISSLLQGCGLQGALLAYGATLVAEGALSGERLIATMFYQGQLMDQFQSVLNTFSSLYKTSGAAAKVFELLDRKPTRPAEAQRPMPPPAVGHVEFADVHFAYPTRPSAQVLRGVSLCALPGRTLALVGPSGAGKSTLFHLLEAFYAPDRGRVTLDGVDAWHAPAAWLHAAIALVSQEPVLFRCSIEENILYTRCAAMAAAEEAADAAAASAAAAAPRPWLRRRRAQRRSHRPDEEAPPDAPPSTSRAATAPGVEEAAITANAHAFVSALPAGYATQVGERGVQLSGGQKQRIAIARAVLQDPRVLLLDEATSALDRTSEAAVQAALANACAGRTVLVIAHRLSTVASADEIAVLHHGMVVERGTHAQLLAAPLPAAPGTVTYRTLAAQLEATAAAAGDAP